MAAYNTNLAGEFFILSVLYRLGADANLTLGNKKSVDIVVGRMTGTVQPSGSSATARDAGGRTIGTASITGGKQPAAAKR